MRWNQLGHQFLAIATVGALGLAGCDALQSEAQKTADTAATAAKDKATDATKGAVDAAKQKAGDATKAVTDKAAGAAAAMGSFKELTTIVNDTKTAVQSGDFAKAKESFGKFEGIWKTVEDGLMKKSPQAYAAVEKSIEEVTTDLKAGKPDKAKVLGALGQLGQNLTTAMKP